VCYKREAERKTDWTLMQTRALLPALRATPYSTPSRIIWTGSLEAREAKYTPSDFQCVDAVKSPKPYDSCKYQCEIAALGMEELLNRSRLRTQPGTPLPLGNGEQETTSTASRSASGVLEPKSFLAHPGVVASSIFADSLNMFMAICMKFVFYLARWTLSEHHNIDGYKGAVAASHVALAPSSHLNTSLRYGAQSDFYGREYVKALRVDGWYENEPTGPGKKEKLEMIEMESSSLHKEGDYVRLLARDLIIKCEGVAKRVWKEAREGALPPFAELDEDEFEDGERNKKVKGAILDPDLLPRVEGAKESSGLLQTEGSMSSQESWEKVDEAV
jgi:3-keto steroid reductase